MRSIIKPFLYFISMLLAISCLDIDEKQEQLSLASDFKEVVINNEYKLMFPKYMKEVGNLNDDASLQYQNMFKETYAIIIDEYADDFLVTFEGTEDYDDTKTVLENYKEVQRNSLFAIIGDLYEYPERTLNANGIETLVVSVEGVVDNIDVVYTAAFYHEKKKVYMLLLWTLKDKRETYQYTFDQIIKSFNVQTRSKKKRKN